MENAETINHFDSQKPDQTVDYVAWIKSMSTAEKKLYINVCLDEFEATIDSVKHSKCYDAMVFKLAKSWGEHHKKLLKLLGYRKRLPVVGGKRVKPSVLKMEDSISETYEKN